MPGRNFGAGSVKLSFDLVGQLKPVLETTLADISPNFVGDRTQTAIFREVGVNLAIPGGIVLLADKGS